MTKIAYAALGASEAELPKAMAHHHWASIARPIPVSPKVEKKRTRSTKKLGDHPLETVPEENPREVDTQWEAVLEEMPLDVEPPTEEEQIRMREELYEGFHFEPRQREELKEAEEEGQEPYVDHPIRSKEFAT